MFVLTCLSLSVCVHQILASRHFDHYMCEHVGRRTCYSNQSVWNPNDVHRRLSITKISNACSKISANRSQSQQSNGIVYVLTWKCTHRICTQQPCSSLKTHFISFRQKRGFCRLVLMPFRRGFATWHRNPNANNNAKKNRTVDRKQSIRKWQNLNTVFDIAKSTHPLAFGR